MECLQLDSAELAENLSGGWTVAAGPFDTETECLASCGGGSGSGSGGACPGAPLPGDLTVTITNLSDCPCADGVTFTLPKISDTQAHGDTTICGTDTVVDLQCNEGHWIFNLVNGGAIMTVLSTSPLHLQASGTMPDLCVDGMGTVTIDITE